MENVVYTCNGVLFRLKKEGNPATYNMDELWKYYVKWKKPITKDSSFQGLRGEGYEEMPINGHKSSIMQAKF